MNKPVLHGVDDPLRIWEGQVDVQDLSRPYPADVEMRWKPSPQLRVNFVGDLDYVDQVRVFTTSSGGELRNREGRIVPPLGGDGKPAVRFLGHPLSMSANLETIDMSGGTLLRAQGGDSTAVARIRFVLVNFPPFRGNAVAVHDGATCRGSWLSIRVSGDLNCSGGLTPEICGKTRRRGVDSSSHILALRADRRKTAFRQCRNR